MYNLEDKSYQKRPKTMSEKTSQAYFRKLNQHVIDNKINLIVVILHGGEPLLVKKEYLDSWATQLFTTMNQNCTVLLRLQTNGILLDNEWINILYKHNIRIGVSLDGPREFNDKFRVTKSGKGTFDSVKSGLDTLLNHPHGNDVFGAILSVANPHIPPHEMWKFWIETGFTRFDFNLPHCTYENKPWFSIDELSDWMISLFEIWWNFNNPAYEIRFFKNIINLILGSSFSTDYIGGKPGGIVVIETDGSIQGTDALRACENEMTNLNMNIFDNELNDALNIPLVKLSNHSSSQLAPKCLSCRVKSVCGGGYLAHRFSKENKFNNPSVYCDALYNLISHIRNKIISESGELFQIN
ncbi:hypothetical protein BH10BAC5_BH10BAC5_20090 [soil metagenome]